jgi:hypothetical protein
MQARSTCGARPYKQFWTGVLQMVFGALTLAARARGGLYQGVVLDICHIYMVSC